MSDGRRIRILRRSEAGLRRSDVGRECEAVLTAPTLRSSVTWHPASVDRPVLFRGLAMPATSLPGRFGGLC